MKTKLKRISKSALSIILALMMVVSTMAVSIVVTNAATIPANTKIYLDLSGATSFANSDSVYMSVVGSSNSNYHFSNLDTSKVANYAPKNDTNWVKMDSVTGSDNIYVATVNNESTVGKVSFWNKDMNNWDNVYQAHAIGAVTYDGTNNMFVVGSEYKNHGDRRTDCYGGTWTTYVAPKYSSYYLRGSYNSWGAEQMLQSDDDAYAYIQKSGTGQFKITTSSSNYNTQYNSGNIKNDLSSVTNVVTLNDSGGNCNVASVSGNFYILLMYPNTAYNSTSNYYVCASTSLPTAATTTYTVTYGKVGSGTVTAKNGDTQISDNPATVDANTKVTFTADADTGYQFDGWYSDSTCETQLADSSSTTYEVTVTENKTVYAKFTAINYTVTYGTGGTGSGSVTAKKDGTTDIVTSPASVAYNSSVTFEAKADSGSQFSGWYSDAECTYAISGATQSSTEYTATITANTTVYAKFIPEESPSQQYFLFHSDKTDNYAPIYDKMDESNGIYSITTTEFRLNNDNKFKITNSDASGSADSADASVGYGVDPASPNYTITVGPLATAAGITVVNLGSRYYDFQIKDNNNTGTKAFVIKYTPNGTNGLNGVIYVEFASSTPTLATPKIKGDSSALPESTITVALDNQKNYGTDEDGDGEYTSDYENLTFTYTVTASDSSVPEVTYTASGKILASDGTTAINDKISFPASATEGVTYTITCKVSADGFDDVTSSEFTVKVGTVSFAQSGRLYAYAGTLADSATPDPQAWIAAENNAIQQAVYKTNTSSNNYPTLGSASSTDLRIFLPTSASDSSVVLYNNYSSSITLKNSTTNAETTINSGEKATVAYAPGQSFTFTADGVDRTLVIYKSSAQGALYLNNTGNYAGYTDAGVPKMIEQLYTDKEKGELADGTGNAGAYSDKNGNVVNAAVKKIKGRGNSTWNYTDKKSFNVTFTDKFKGFGFSGKKFSLLANFKDPSLSRNNILYQLADLMGAKYSPNVATVDLYMNGLYMGSYLMCQKVEVGSSDLVNDQGVTDTLLDLDTATAETAAAGFSFLIELDSNSTDGADYKIEVGSQKITLKEPEYLNDSNYKYEDPLTTAIDTYVTGKYNALNTAMSNTSITYNELNAIIDVKSLANYYLLNELAKNYDIGVTSTYLVYNKTDEKFYISPVWDLDVSTCNSKTDSNYTSFEGNWTDKNSDYNYFMKKVFANPQVQSAARAKWTDSYYTELVNEINELADGAITNISGSYENNFKKWSYPYGFTGQGDSIVELTSLTTASYDVSTHTYSKASSATSYGSKTAEGTINYVRDWLLSRVAWMTNKYNTYTLSGYSGWSDASAVTNSSVNGVTTWKLTSSSSTSAFKISTDGYAGTDLTDACINYDTSVKIVNDSSVATISAASGTNMNFGFTSTGTISESSPVYLIYNQKTNTLTLSDTQSTSSNPSVTLKGSTVDNADIKDGTAVTLTATITPATNNNVVVTGDYTATLYIGDKVVTTKTVTFAEDATEETTMNAVFSTYLEGTNQTYKVVVTCNGGEQDLTGTSNTVSYKQTGVKDQKIYFDPSTHTATVNSTTVYDWLEATNKDSVVTVTLSDSTTFKMYIDSDDVHGLDKGVFRADIDEDTLEKLKNDSNITFSMDGTSLTCSVAGQSDITSGWIYNYSSQVDTDSDNSKHSQALWEQYNVEYVEAYPGGCTTYAEFKAYLAAQVENNTDNIVYFDNSASKWYNVYIYGWGSSGPTKDAVLMKKLPYADIWYYDFGSDNVTASFLFKDRSNRGYGNNYQQTVDLVNGYVLNGDNERVTVNFQSTINKANPIFITQNFYKVTQQNGGGVHKFRAFNTQWDEFADVVASDVQTKAVDIYFDLHDDSATDIQLYHTSTNSKYTFASEFTRLTQMPGSTIYHSTIMLPYTDNGIAFKFDKFVVNYSGGKKTCTMSAKVQPTFTCINTGEVWYEINSDFANLGYDTAVRSASLNLVNTPLLTASEVTPSIVYIPTDLTVGGNTVSGIYLWSDNSMWIDYTYDSTLNNLEDFPIVKIQNKSYYAATYYITDGSSNFHFKLRSLNYETKECTPYAVGNSYIITNTEIANQGTATYRTTTETTVYVAGNFADKKNDVNHFAVYSGSNSVDYDFAFTATEYTYNGYTVYKAVAIDVSTLKTYAHIDATDNADSKRISNIIYDDTVGNYDNKLYYYAGSDSSENRWITDPVWDATDEPTISFTPDSISLILDNGTASATLTPTVTNASGKKVAYSVDNTDGVSLTPSDDTLSAAFVVTKAGTYVVTAKIEGTTATDQVTITVSEPVTTDYCGVLAYNHSTATFDVTGGGTIDKTDVVLKNGYYDNSVDGIKTGYTSYDGTTYTVIYALPSTASSGATTSYSSTTSHSNEGTGEGQYSFDGWTKDGVIPTENETMKNRTMSDAISGTATVAYVANWSEEVMVTYTFTYVYDMYDTKTNGKEYHADGAFITNSDYKVQVSLSENAKEADVIAAYLANAPKISSDYFTYTFDDTNVTITVDLNNHTAEATAKIASVKKYKVTFNNEDGIVSADEYFYQNIVTLTQSAPSGYVTVWKDEKGNTLYVGDSYSFRITRNIIIESESVDSTSLTPATYVNDPTYEFFTSGTTEYVKFKVRVDNVLAGVTPYEYGTLYFFTDENGVPVDSTISVDNNIDSDKLTAAALGSASTGIKKYDATDIVNADHKFIYAPYIKNTAANRDRYLRVYSYYIYKDKEGNDVVVISSDSVLASIRNALNES